MTTTLKNFCLATCLIGGLVSFTACNPTDKNELDAKNTTIAKHELTIHFNLNDGLALDNLSHLQLIVKNDKGMNDTLQVKEGDKLSLIQGQYALTVTGKVIDEAAAYVQGTAQIDLFANKTADITLHKVLQSPIIFKTIYTSGAKEKYLNDSFFELVNNSNDVQYLDGLILSAPQGIQKGQNPWQANGFESLYACGQGTVIAFPGSGKEYPIQPGESVIIANDAANHKELSGGENKCPDLSKAQWDIYISAAKGDIDYPARNMKIIFHNNTNMKAFGIGLFGRAYILARCPEGVSVEDFAANPSNLMTTPKTTSKMQFLMIPSKYVLDAVDVWSSKDITNYPTFLPKDDAQGVVQAAANKGKCVQRKVLKTERGRVYYKDTNNSSADWDTNVDLTF